MKKNLMITSAVAAVVAFTACSKSDSNNGSGSTVPTVNIPEKLEPMEIVQGRELTDAEKSEIKASFKNSGKIPDAQLMIVKKNESSEERQKREDKIAKLEGRSKEIFADMQAHCKVTVIEPDQKDLKYETGAVINQDSESYLSGNECPQNFTNVQKAQTKVIYSNLEEIKKEYENTNDPKVYDKLSIKNEVAGSIHQANDLAPALQKELGLKGMRIEADFTAVNDSKINSSRSHMKIAGTIQLKQVSANDIGASVDMEILSGNGSNESNMKTAFKYPFGDVVLQISVKDAKSKIYLNGKEISEKELKDLFGESSFGTASDQK